MRDLLTLLLICSALLGGCASVEAVPAPVPVAPTAEEEEIARLEQVFWYCDYTATKRGALAAPIAACQHATQELKRLKFGGRYNLMLAWWRDNKVAEHRKVELSQNLDRL